MENLDTAMTILAHTGALPAAYHPHELSGKYSGCWESNIEPNRLLVWKQDDDRLTLLLLATGTHSDLF